MTLNSIIDQKTGLVEDRIVQRNPRMQFVTKFLKQIDRLDIGLDQRPCEAKGSLSIYIPIVDCLETMRY